MNEVKRDQHVIISLKQIREICTQFSEVRSRAIALLNSPKWMLFSHPSMHLFTICRVYQAR